MTVLAGIAIFLGLMVLAALAVGGYNLALTLWRRTVATRQDLATMRLDVERQRLALDRQRLDLDRERLKVTEKVWPDAHGQYPLLWDGHQALDPNRGIVFSIQDGAQVITPALTRPEQLARMLRAAGSWPGSSGAGAELLAEPERALHWPSRVPLAGLLDGPPSARSLVLGVTMTPDGPVVVRGDMARMVHVAVGGSSGWGKSVFLRVVAYQLAKSAESVDLVMVDLEGATFAPFATCGRLLWPVADTESDALAIFSELTSELDRRKELFARYPGVDSLQAYNTRAAEPLTPVIALVDEATALLGDKNVESALRTLALRARKYGLWLVLGGQDWKAASLDTAIRNQLSTRIQFRAMSASQSRVLLQQAGAENLGAKGRALVWLPGRDLVELQAPYIGHQDIIAAVADRGPRQAMPDAPSSNNDQDDERVRRILELADQGKSKRQICLEVFGYAGGRAFDEVSRVLDSTTTPTGPPGGAQGSGTGNGCSSSTTKESSRH